MRKSSSSPQETEVNTSSTAGKDRDTGTPIARGWPFAPGSQLAQQVARPWVPKPAYRFNQR